MERRNPSHRGRIGRSIQRELGVQCREVLHEIPVTSVSLEQLRGEVLAHPRHDRVWCHSYQMLPPAFTRPVLRIAVSTYTERCQT